MKIDINAFIPGCPHFVWGEVLWLHEWKFHAIPTVQQYKNLIRITGKLEKIREIVDSPIRVTSGLRPEAYNRHIKGAYLSQHRFGAALDFQVENFPGIQGAAHVRGLLLPYLDDLKIRMENIVGSWVHIDSKQVKDGDRRFFRP